MYLPCASPVNFFFPPAGNGKKSASILQKALASNAKPVELLQMAMKNLKSGKSQLLPAENKENVAGQLFHYVKLFKGNYQIINKHLYDQKYVDTCLSHPYVLFEHPIP